jgi:hypothetical protein
MRTKPHYLRTDRLHEWRFSDIWPPLRRFDSGWPSGSANHAAEVAAPEGGILICEHVGLNVAECGLWLVP